MAVISIRLNRIIVRSYGSKVGFSTSVIGAWLMAAKWQRIKVDIDSKYTPSQREALGDRILEFIRVRTEKGKDKNNRRFPGYSESYTESLDFKISGKSKGDVNLTLSGDMLIEMDLLKHKKGALLIGFDKNSEENGRADGNIRGTYGQSSPIPGKKRDFLGITKKDLIAVQRKFDKDNS